MKSRLDSASGKPTQSATQSFLERRYTRSRSDSANDNKDAYDGDNPHRLYPEYPCRDHDGRDYDANN
jgi:hypothetical protein